MKTFYHLVVLSFISVKGFAQPTLAMDSDLNEIQMSDGENLEGEPSSIHLPEPASTTSASLFASPMISKYAVMLR